MREIFRKLYVDGFPEDNDGYVDYCFGCKFSEANALINASNTSALHIVNKKMRYGKKMIILPYLVAVSTLTERRGSGEIKELIRECFGRLSDSQTPFVALYPFNHDYYERYGFVTVDYSPKIANNIDFRKVNYTEFGTDMAWHASECKSIYDRYYGDYDRCCERDCNAFMEKLEEEFAGGATLNYLKRGAEECLIGYVIESADEVTEAVCLDKDYYSAELNENVQMRIIDSKCALELYDYSESQDADLLICVYDEMLGTEFYYLTVRNGEAKVTDYDGYDSESNFAINTTVGNGKFKVAKNGVSTVNPKTVINVTVSELTGMLISGIIPVENNLYFNGMNKLDDSEICELNNNANNLSVCGANKIEECEIGATENNENNLSVCRVNKIEECEIGATDKIGSFNKNGKKVSQALDLAKIFLPRIVGFIDKY